MTMKREVQIGGVRLINFCVVHVDPMSWSILASLGNSDASPIVSFQLECDVEFPMV